MAKVIKYRILSCEVNRGTEETPNMVQIFRDVTIDWNETNEEIAKREAYNGEYKVEDVEVEEETPVATLEDRVDTLETDSTEMKEALDLLLSGVTE